MFRLKMILDWIRVSDSTNQITVHVVDDFVYIRDASKLTIVARYFWYFYLINRRKPGRQHYYVRHRRILNLT